MAFPVHGIMAVTFTRKGRSVKVQGDFLHPKTLPLTVVEGLLPVKFHEALRQKGPACLFLPVAVAAALTEGCAELGGPAVKNLTYSLTEGVW